MKLREFYDKVMAAEDIEWYGVKFGKQSKDDEVVVIWKDRPALKAVIVATEILRVSWEELYACITQMRKWKALKWMTRIVGYYSITDNWNPSKLEELEDRHAGEYSVPDKSKIQSVGEVKDAGS